MTSRENIIISVTTWWKRAGNLARVLDSILHQTLMPNRILVNLCTEDFPEKQDSLPEDLNRIISGNSIIELYWTDDNTKAWKKHLHAIEVAGDNDLIMSIDDDHIYPSDYIEKMYVSYLYYGKRFPITLNKVLLFQNLWCFNGPGILYRKKDLPENYKKLFTYNILHNCANDTAMTLFFAANNVICMPMIYRMPDDADMLFGDNDAYTDRNAVQRHESTGGDASIKKIDDLHLSSKYALEETFLQNGLVSEDCKFSPNFWETVQNLFGRMESDYPVNRPAAMEFILSKWKENPMNPNVYGIDFRSLRLDLPRLSKSELVGPGNKVVVTVASWTNRINNVPQVVDDIMHNTIVPDVVVINLAKSDFGIDSSEIVPSVWDLVSRGVFPQGMLDIYLKYPQVTIHWYDDAELKSWKKHLYVLSAFREDDVIICIDDDIKYRETFIETMLKSYNLYGRKHPVTGCTVNYQIGMFPFHGSYTLYTPGFFEGYRKYLTRDILHVGPEDNHMGYMLGLLGKVILPVIGGNYLVYDMSFNETDPNFGNGVFNKKWWEGYKRITKKSNAIVAVEEKANPIMKGGWTPDIYNFTNAAVKKFIKETEGETLPYPYDLVRESMLAHLDRFGESTDILHVWTVIDNLIL